MLVSHTVRREGTHFVAVLHTGNRDFYLVWYIGCSGVVSVGIWMHAVLGTGIRPSYVRLPCFIYYN